jgi:hypothetical protein
MSSLSGRPELYRSVVHPAISVGVTVTTMMAALLLLARLAGIGLPRTLTIFLVVGAPLVEASVGNILFAERAGIGNRAREFIIYLLLAYLLLSVVRTGPFAARFTPSPEHALPLVAIALAWIEAFGIHNRLRGREALLRRFHGLFGEDLRHALVDRQHDMATIVRDLRHVRSTAATGMAVVFLIAFVAGSGLVPGSNLPVRSFAFVVLMLQAGVSLWAIGLLNSFMEEYSANGVGIAVPFRFQRRQMLTALPVILVILLGALIVARPNDLLPFDRVLAFFRWFAGLFERDAQPVPRPLPPPSIEQSDYYETLRELMAGTEVTPPLWLRVLGILLRRLAIALGVVTAFLVVFGPLFSAEFRAALRRVGLRKKLKLWFSGIRRQLVLVFRWIGLRLARRRRLDAGTDAAEVSYPSPKRHVGWTPSFAKRRQMDRAVSVFVSIAGWGTRRGIVYRPSEGARDYLRRVAEVAPERYTDTALCADVFWEARYSRDRVSRRRMQDYVAAAKRITATD